MMLGRGVVAVVGEPSGAVGEVFTAGLAALVGAVEGACLGARQ